MDGTMDAHMVTLIGGIVLVVMAALGLVVRSIERKKLAADAEYAREQERLAKEHAIEMAKLDLAAQGLAIEQELLAEKKKRLMGTATPTGLRHRVVKTSLSQEFPAVTDADLDASIHRAAKAASTLVRKVAPSIMPTSRESAQHAINLPPLDDLPRDEAVLDVSAIQDAHEVDGDES
jgi:hypothetical protein